VVSAPQCDCGSWLRELRVANEHTIEDVAKELMCSPAKVSRMESAGRGIQPRDVRDLARFYKITNAERQELELLLHDSRKRGWWQDSGITDPETLTFLGLEAAASLIRVADSRAVHGLLQTEAYMKALLPGLRPPGDPWQVQIDDIVAARMERQKRFWGSGRGFQFIMDEACITRIIGDPGVMREQITKLIEVARNPQATIRVLPFARGSSPMLDGSFQIMSFPDQMIADTVYVEGLVGMFVIDKKEKVDEYIKCWNHIGDHLALTPDESVDWLRSKVA
jgi:transcriptional regulator with XRE-family HTH domain